MSLTADRAAIASALDAVADITGYDDVSPMLNVGDAWVRWGGYEATRVPLVFATTWRIFLVTGGTPADAMVFLDSHLEAILDAIDSLVFLEGVQPVEFQLPNSGVLYGAEITGQKES